MDCRKARYWMQLGLDGELPSDRQSRLASHLVQCAECRWQQQQLSAVQAGFRQMAEPIADEQVGELEFGPGQPVVRWRMIAAMAAVLAAAITIWMVADRVIAPVPTNTVAHHDSAEEQRIVHAPTDAVVKHDPQELQMEAHIAPGPTSPASPDPQPAFNELVHVRMKSPSETIVVPMPTRNRKVSVFWIYPTIKTVEAPADSQSKDSSAS
jgi:hypothetical protein